MPQFAPIWARIQVPDIGKVFLQAQQFNALRLQNEERRQKMERDAHQAAFMEQVHQAQRELAMADTPQKQEAARVKMNSIAPKLFGEIQSNEIARREDQRKQGKAKFELHMKQNLEGAQLMERMLPNTLAQAPDGSQVVNMRALFQASQEMKAYADRGMVDQRQADQVNKLFRGAQEIYRQQQLGPRDPEIQAAKMQEVVTGINDLTNSSKMAADTFGDEEKRRRFQAETELIADRVGEMTGDGKAFGDPIYARENYPKEYEQAAQMVRGEKFGRAQAGGGLRPLTRGAETQIQKQWIASKTLLKNYQRAKGTAEPWMFTIPGKAAIWAGELVAKFDPDLVPEGIRGKFDPYFSTTIGLERAFSLYRKKITGAQAAMKEIQYLRDQAANSSMSWPRFQAAMKLHLDELQYEIQLYNKAMRQGIGQEQAGALPEEGLTNKYINELANEMRGVEITREDRDWRIEALSEGGFSQEEQIQVLLHEGYIDEEEAKAARARLQQ